MASLNISLPEPLKEYVEAQIEAGGYGTPSEYVRNLIREDKDRHFNRLEDNLLEAMKGTPIDISAREIEQGNLVGMLRQRLKKVR